MADAKVEQGGLGRTFQEPLRFIGIAGVCSALSRTVGSLWLSVPLLVVAAVMLGVGSVKLVRAINELPEAERRKEHRRALIGGLGALGSIAVFTGLLLLVLYG